MRRAGSTGWPSVPSSSGCTTSTAPFSSTSRFSNSESTRSGIRRWWPRTASTHCSHTFGDQTRSLWWRKSLKPKVGVGILNFNRAELTIECLDHLAKIDWPADQLQVVVVDNGSSDDSLARIIRAHPAVSLVVSQKNRGFAGGCNLAIAALEGVNYVALLNNDAYVEPGWLGPLVERLESHPNAGAACSKVLFAATYVDLKLESPCFQPVREDTRHLGVRVSGLR